MIVQPNAYYMKVPISFTLQDSVRPCISGGEIFYDGYFLMRQFLSKPKFFQRHASSLVNIHYSSV